MMKRFDIDEILGVQEEIKIKITWRSYFLILILTLTIYFNTVAILDHYENKAFAGFVFSLMILSYILSLTLIRR